MTEKKLVERLRTYFSHLPAGASQSELAEVEDELGRPLPRMLRYLYLDHNGEPDGGRLWYRLLPLHEAAPVAPGEWRFWLTCWGTEEGAVYRAADGSVHLEGVGSSFSSIAEFLEYCLENARPGDEQPSLPDELQGLFEAAEELDCQPRRERLRELLTQIGPEHGAFVARNYLEDEDPQVRLSACEWMGRVKFEGVIDRLAELASCGPILVAAAARQALVVLGVELVELHPDSPYPLLDEVTKMGIFLPDGCNRHVLLKGPREEGLRQVASYGETSRQTNLDITESVRLRPGMYFGSLFAEGTHQLAVELIANAVDQFLLGQASQVVVRHDEWALEVWDDGEGYPLDNPSGEQYLSQFHSDPTGDQHAPHVHLVTRGIGLAAVNAACEELVVDSVRGGRSFRLRYQFGKLVEKSEEPRLALDFPRGTRLQVRLDRTLWGEGFARGWLRRRVFDFVHLMPGLKICLNQEVFQAPNGLLDLAEFQLCGPTLRRFSCHLQNEFLILQVAFVGEARGRMALRSWVNGAATEEHGSHVEGALAALEKVKWRPAQVLVHVILCEPHYAGPVRRKLCVQRVKRQVRAMLRQPLQAYVDSWAH